MDTKLAYIMVAFIQERAASVLERVALPEIKVADGHSLLDQLMNSETDTPEQLTLNFSGLLDILDLTELLQEADPANKILRVFTEPGEVIRKLLEARSHADIGDAIQKFFERDHAQNLKDLAQTIRPFMQRQFGIALSLITTLRHLQDQGLWRGVSDAYMKYFFAEQGYVTVDGIPILPPMHFGGVSSLELDQIKGLLAEKTADRYVRDLIRVTVEAGGDARYDGLRTRHTQMLAKVGDAKKTKATRWFRGISSMAESLVTSSVEEACLGIAQFQTNALIAASAGTYAGTAARKAAQHVFLSELGLEG